MMEGAVSPSPCRMAAGSCVGWMCSFSSDVLPIIQRGRRFGRTGEGD
jgi:hypothetical protein